ncbi:MAG: hypothetical protein IKK96_06090 [Lachnospiraceae bacterium]|nr:hypothetical protein [Lachnospiraceae bacterium]
MIIIDFFSKKEQKQKYIKLTKELREYKNKQVNLYLEGRDSTPQEIANACVVMEEGSYMREYVGNEDGIIIEIRFNKITE